MAKDDRIFRVTKETRYGTKVSYCTRTAVSGMFGTSLYGSRPGRPDIVKVEATSAEATEGWTDVTEEFRNPPKPDLQCKRHKSYTGVQKPRWRWEGDKLCTCWEIYAASHPDYPVHVKGCQRPSIDPETCGCRVMGQV